MKLYTQFVGGIGDILLRMMKPGTHLGYFPALKARGDETMVTVHANTDATIALFENLPYVDHTHFRAKRLRLNGPADYQLLKTWDGLPWQRPELALDDEEKNILESLTREPYVAVHVSASVLNKAIPDPDRLFAGLREANVRVILLGVETQDDAPGIVGNRSDGIRRILRGFMPRPGAGFLLPPPKLRLQVVLAQRAAKFIGTLSCFNCAAQLAHVPSFVFVNRSIKDPGIYKLMADNGARVETWNDGTKDIKRICREAVEWAQ